MSGTSGTLVDQLTFEGKDMRKAMEAQDTILGKMKACSDIPGYGEFNSLTPSQCDDLMIEQCAKSQYYGMPICSCINSQKIKEFQAKYDNFPNCPHVYDKNCQEDGYQLTSYKGLDQCGYLNCSINMINSLVDGSNIQQECSQTVVDGSGNTTNTNQFNEEGDEEKDYMGLLILLVIIILIGSGGAIAYTMYKKKQALGGFNGNLSF